MPPLVELSTSNEIRFLMCAKDLWLSLPFILSKSSVITISFLSLRYKFRLLTSHKNIWPCFSLPFFISHSSSWRLNLFSILSLQYHPSFSIFSFSPSQTFFLSCGSLPKQFPENDSKSELPTGKLCFISDFQIQATVVS